MVESVMEAAVEVVEVVVDAQRSVTAAKVAGHRRRDHPARMHHRCHSGSVHGRKARSATTPTVTAATAAPTAAVTTAAPTAVHSQSGRAHAQCRKGH